MGANLGTVAFDVISTTPLSGFSSGTMPEVELRNGNADAVCEGPLTRLAPAPASSVQYDTGR